MIDRSGFWRNHWAEPRQWQAEALEAIVEEVFDYLAPSPTLVQAVMGSGKSFVIAELCQVFVGWRGHLNEAVVVTAPTIQLVDQLAETIERRLGADAVGRYYTHGHDTDHAVIVACLPSSVQLAQALQNSERICGLWIADEAHRTENETIRAAHSVLQPERTVGFTATPYLAQEKRGLTLFERVVYEYGVPDALKDGVVVPWRIVPWTGRECSVDEACVAMLRRARGPGIVNAVTIEDAEAFAHILTEAGISARAVHSQKPRRARKELFEALRSEKIKALVHVSLLQEGVDFPWLRWMCLRRPVSSRVRFAQEVGRGIRACNGKDHVVFYDPHDLFGEFRLSYEAVVGGEWLIKKASERHPVERSLELLLELPASQLAEKKSLKMSRVGRYLRQLASAVEAAGMIERSLAAGSWRSKDGTTKQLDLIKRLAPTLAKVQNAPPAHLEALRVCYSTRDVLTRGQASDFLSILLGLVKKPRVWPDIAKLMADPEGVKEEGDGSPAAEDSRQFLLP